MTDQQRAARAKNERRYQKTEKGRATSARKREKRRLTGADCAAYWRTYRLRQYGLTNADLVRMTEEQGGKCAICSTIRKTLCVDHDHVTGEVRMLLCNQCNLALGNFHDSSAILEKAAAYLRRFNR